MEQSRQKHKDDSSAMWSTFGSLLLRFALGFLFLPADADRFGLWGPLGKPHVEWPMFSDRPRAERDSS